MRRLTSADVPALLARFEAAADGSLVALSTVFGYSRSELEAWLRDPASLLFADADGGLLVQVADVDRGNAMARVQLCGRGEAAPVEGLLAALGSDFGLERLYSYLFPWESDERALLLQLGCLHEATFREHLYARGGYQDIEVYGRLEACR